VRDPRVLEYPYSRTPPYSSTPQVPGVLTGVPVLQVPGGTQVPPSTPFYDPVVWNLLLSLLASFWLSTETSRLSEFMIDSTKANNSFSQGFVPAQNSVNLTD
jgi:hypothetical protein